MRSDKSLSRSVDGAVAPTVALSLVGLIAAGGLAFDYSRMATLDTELQTAADQAALAAATQLDGGTNARSRATAAANSLIRNITLFADNTNAPNSDQRRITVPTITYYQSYDAGTDTPGAVATTDANAQVVVVAVGARRASFALTPIVGAINSGNLSAQAVASLSSAVCKVPPLMICAPSSSYPSASDIGKGILLEPGGGGAWVPGNYGYLDFGNGANAVAAGLGNNGDSSVCRDNTNGIWTEPGNQASVTKDLNSRFDLYDNAITTCNPSNGNYCPAENTTKDAWVKETVKVAGVSTTVPANPGCGAPGAVIDAPNGSASFDRFAFRKESPPADPRGFPRDTCHINGSCTSKFGNGTWDTTTYLNDAHPSDTASSIAASLGKTAATITRWDVYRWELADKVNRLATKTRQIGNPTFAAGNGNGGGNGNGNGGNGGGSGNGQWTFVNQCIYPKPKTGTAVVAGPNQKDRRLLTVAIVDCTGGTGKFKAKVLRFADMFLVEPSLDRTTPYATGKDQIYVELVRVAERPNGQSAFQYYLRQRPRLIK